MASAHGGKLPVTSTQAQCSGHSGAARTSAATPRPPPAARRQILFPPRAPNFQPRSPFPTFCRKLHISCILQIGRLWRGMAENDFQGHSRLSSQGERWVAVTPSNTVDLETIPKALWCDVAGTLELMGHDGHIEIFNVLAGFPISLRPIRILAANTNATGIKAIY